MQALTILRGCFAAYITGVIIVWMGFLAASYLFGPSAEIGPWMWLTLFASAAYGAVLAAIVTVFVLLVWLVLAWRRSLVLWWIAPISSLAVGLLFASVLGGEVVFIIAAMLGLFLGSIFWLAAFGRSKSALLRLNFEAA